MARFFGQEHRVILHPLYHWSPTQRRASILKRGLACRSRPVVNSHRADYLCFSTSASQAWALSAGAFGERGQEWDCWQVSLDTADEVAVREFHGNRIEEIRVRNNVPKSRVWLVGTRSVPLRGRRW
jgi:hypothetical protein